MLGRGTLGGPDLGHEVIRTKEVANFTASSPDVDRAFP